jgi:hypothetical protein
MERLWLFPLVPKLLFGHAVSRSSGFALSRRLDPEVEVKRSFTDLQVQAELGSEGKHRATEWQAGSLPYVQEASPA